jgi:plasmid replication initiation protein
MSKLVVKDNVLIDASYNLDMVEQRLILLAIVEARETGKGISHDTLLQVHASSYINQFHVEKHTAYKVLREAAKTIFSRYVTYHDINSETGKERTFHVRWVDKIGYEQDSGLVFLRFSQDVVPLITRLEANFTSYEIQQISSLTSAYAIRLYEVLIKWRSTGKTPMMMLSDLRGKLGVENNEYEMMSDFKKRVLDIAIDQINEHTDITVNYEQHKAGRVITGFTFSLKQKKQPKDVTPKAKPKPKSSKSTDYSEIDALLKNNEWVSQHAQTGESWEDARARLRREAETGKFSLAPT